MRSKSPLRPLVVAGSKMKRCRTLFIGCRAGCRTLPNSIEPSDGHPWCRKATRRARGALSSRDSYRHGRCRAITSRPALSRCAGASEGTAGGALRSHYCRWETTGGWARVGTLDISQTKASVGGSEVRFPHRRGRTRTAGDSEGGGGVSGSGWEITREGSYSPYMSIIYSHLYPMRRQRGRDGDSKVSERVSGGDGEVPGATARCPGRGPKSPEKCLCIDL